MSLLDSDGYPTGVLQADTQHMVTDYMHGIRIAVLELHWNLWEPTEGNPDEDYIAEQTAKVEAYRRAGYRIGIVSGVHNAPAWLLAKTNAQLKDQWDNASGHPNFQWSSTVRSYAAAYLTAVVEAMGDVEFHRVGLSPSGETLYPEASNNGSLPSGEQENNWWAFDGAAQADCPLPGWVPGEAQFGSVTVTPAMARAWYDWYFGALVDAHAWQIATFRAAGWEGTIQIVTPGAGCLPAEHNTRIAGGLAPISNDPYFVMNTGAVWWRFYDEMPDLAGCGLTASSVYDQSGIPRGNVTEEGDDEVAYTDSDIYYWSSTRWLSSLARRHGMQSIMGENPGNTDPADAKHVFATAAGCGLSALLWAFDPQLHDGGAYAQIGDLAPLILLHRPAEPNLEYVEE